MQGLFKYLYLTLLGRKHIFKNFHLDTNVIYQALKSSAGASFYILKQVRERKIQIALSVPLFEEYQDVLKREKSLQDFKNAELKFDQLNVVTLLSQ